MGLVTHSANLEKQAKARLIYELVRQRERGIDFPARKNDFNFCVYVESSSRHTV